MTIDDQALFHAMLAGIRAIARPDLILPDKLRTGERPQPGPQPAGGS